MLAWMTSFGALKKIGIECTGTYGSGLLRYFQNAELEVLEVTVPDSAKATCNQFWVKKIAKRSQRVTAGIVTGNEIKGLRNTHKKSGNEEHSQILTQLLDRSTDP